MVTLLLACPCYRKSVRADRSINFSGVKPCLMQGQLLLAGQLQALSTLHP